METKKKVIRKTIRIVQRTAIGHDNSGRTTLYLAVGEFGLNPVRKGDDYDVIVKFIHPLILCGSWEENMRDFARIATDNLIANGLMHRNEDNGCVWID